MTGGRPQATCTFVGGDLVTWHSKKNTIIAKLSAETEFLDMAQAVCELLWIKIILIELKLASSGVYETVL